MKTKKIFLVLFFLSLIVSLATSFFSDRGTYAQTSAQPSDEATNILQNTDWDAEEPEESQEEAAPIDLQNTDWDAEESETPKKDDSPLNLQNTDWDAEESEEEATEEDKTEQTFFAPPPRTEERALTEGEIAFIHWTGGFFFLFYLSGGFLTGYFLRNAGIATKCPPDVLILLHVFWPIEWLLAPLFKKSPSSAVQEG